MPTAVQGCYNPCVLGTTLPPSSPYLPPVTAGRRLEELALIESLEPTAVAKLEKVRHDLAWAKLTESGIVARVVRASPLRIVGGLRKIEVDGLVAYEKSFSLWQEGSEYHAGIAGNGNLGIRCGPCSLDNAVSFLQQQYVMPAGKKA